MADTICSKPKANKQIVLRLLRSQIFNHETLEDNTSTYLIYKKPNFITGINSNNHEILYSFESNNLAFTLN